MDGLSVKLEDLTGKIRYKTHHGKWAEAELASQVKQPDPEDLTYPRPYRSVWNSKIKLFLYITQEDIDDGSVEQMKEYSPTYTVWRRSDGYVAASASDNGVSAKSLGWGVKDTFEILLDTKEWCEARNLIESERAKMDNPFPWKEINNGD